MTTVYFDCILNIITVKDDSMWKDKHFEMPPEEDRADKFSFFVSMVGITITCIMTQSPTLMIIVGLGLYIGIRWSRAL